MTEVSHIDKLRPTSIVPPDMREYQGCCYKDGLDSKVAKVGSQISPMMVPFPVYLIEI